MLSIFDAIVAPNLIDMLLETEIFIGDIVELSPSKLSTLDDLDLEKCTVLEIDVVNKHIKVVFNNDNNKNETFFDVQSTVDWFSMVHVIDIERDYTIVSLTDNQDTVTNQPVTIMNMAKLVKKVSHNQSGYTISSSANEKNIEAFIFVGIKYDDLIAYKGKTKRISFSKFRGEDVMINGITVKAWYANNKIVDVEDIFVLG